MRLDELIAALKAKGYTHVSTFGGNVPLADWDPYGKRRTNRDVTDHAYMGELIDTPDGPKVRDAGEADPPFVLGVWSFTKEV